MMLRTYSGPPHVPNDTLDVRNSEWKPIHVNKSIFRAERGGHWKSFVAFPNKNHSNRNKTTSQA
jgi:hypothetical protein